MFIITLHEKPFQKWGLDFMNLLNQQVVDILVAINYATKWVEARALRTNTTIVIAKFLYDHILI